MDTKSETNKTIEIGGRTFKITKSGLDIDEVTAFIKELVGERDSLLKRQANLASLTRLYEKTVIEAGELAKQIEKEAREQVQKEANTILTQAHERAKVMVEQQKAEATALIQQQLKSVKGNVKQQIDTLLKEEIEKLRSTIKEAARRVSEEMVSQAETLAPQSKDFTIDLDQDILKPAPVMERSNNGEKPLAASAGQTGAPSVPLTGKNEKDIHEIEIMLPRDQDEIASINRALLATPEIKSAELLTMVDKSVFKVALHKPIDLLAMLRTLPEVYTAEPVVKDGRRKIVVALEVKARLEQKHNILGEKIMDVLTDTKP
jgi:uncharacterized protein YaaQ